MEKIDFIRTGEYLKATLTILKEKGGEYPSNELIKELERRLTLNDYEKGLNNSGQYRWLTRLRFYSIGLVKAGWLIKKNGKWTLTDKAKDFESMTPIELYNFNSNAYDSWYKTRDKNEILDVEENETDEPNILMEIKPDDITFTNLIAGIDSCKIQIPPFQRSFVWSPPDIRYLLDSIYRGYPIGSFIFWKTSRKLPRTRNIGNLLLSNDGITEGTEISYVIDGQQRITSLYAAIKGSRIDEESFRFMFDLRKKKFIVSKVDDSKENNPQEDAEELLISVGSIFTESRAKYNEITNLYPPEYQGLLHNLYDRFITYRFSVIQVVDQSSLDDDSKAESVRQVVRMFSRINETGRKLTVVAKMVARCWGEGFDLREALDEFFGRDKRLLAIREEILLQAFSVVINFRKSHSRDILETNIQKLESEWDKITDAFLLAVQFVTTRLHIKKLDYLPFDAVLVPLTYFFYKKHEPTNTEAEALEKWFWRVCLSNRYDATVAPKIEEDCDYFDEILKGTEPKFNYLIDWDTLKERLITQPYNLRNAFVKTVLSLYSFMEPKNLTDGSNISLDGVFSGYYKHNLHHIFPLKYLRENESKNKDLFDSIVNIMFIPAITNINISGTEPRVYMGDFQSNNNNHKQILINHLIPDISESGLLENNFKKFLDYRAGQIFQSFRVRTGMASASEELFDTQPTKPIDLLESRLRMFLHEKLKENSEDSYWEEYIPADIKEVVDKKIQDEARRHPYKLEEFLRDDVRITFLDIMDYLKIINANWNLFESFFGNKNVLEEHFKALKYFRNPVKHSRDLSIVDKKRGEASVLWFEEILKDN